MTAAPRSNAPADPAHSLPSHGSYIRLGAHMNPALRIDRTCATRARERLYGSQLRAAYEARHSPPTSCPVRLTSPLGLGGRAAAKGAARRPAQARFVQTALTARYF